MLKVGNNAPEFSTITHSGSNVSSDAQKGSKYVIYFYPKDNTPGCTKEACSFRDNYQLFLDKGIAVFGVSGGNSQSHQKFIDKYNLPFPLLMDEKLDLAKKYGAYKRGNRVARITYLVDEKGIIEGIYGLEGHEKVKSAEHATQIIEFWKI
ncbi:MAG: peroxiredoxin [Candidatus Hodarchaeales archaeon]|jgi:peroxiredoxin Q/BCP